MAEVERGYMGMTHNPFAQPSEGFFERGERKAHLDHLRHLSQWTRRVLLVAGPQGAGKSVLFRQLSTSLEARAKAARINGTLVNSTREVLAAVAQGYGIALAPNANSQSIVAQITSHVVEQESAERFCVTLVDDAEALEAKALESLCDLAAASPMRLVLFGDLPLVPAVERAARHQEMDWHVIRLTGLNGEDARDYLEWRFAEAKYRGRLPFTDQQVAEIVRISEGLPGRMNQLANVMLAKLESGDVRPDRTRFPPAHRALVALLALVAGVGYLMWYQSDRAAVPLAGAPPVVSESSSVPADATPSGNPSATAPATALPASNPTPTPTPTSDAAVATLEPVSGRAANEVAVARSEPEPVAPSAEQQLPAWGGLGWLQQQSPGDYTVQLASVSSFERAQAFLDRQPADELFVTYPLARDGRELHVILYGLFDTYEAAQAASATLPASVGRVQPWVRSIGAIQRAAGVGG